MKSHQFPRRAEGVVAALILVVTSLALVLGGAGAAHAGTGSGKAAVATQRMTGPTLNTTQAGWYAKGSVLTLTCYQRGQSVKGYYSPWIPGGWDNLWYKVSDGYWVADVDINTGSNNPVTPPCASTPAPSSGQPANWNCYVKYSRACISQFGYGGTPVAGYPVDGWGNNCTNYVAYRLMRNGASNYAYLRNGSDWDENARARGFRVDQRPGSGSVAQWNGGYGHVAYVDWVSADGNRVAISESGYNVSASLPSMSGRRILVRGQAGWPSNFLHIRDV